MKAAADLAALEAAGERHAAVNHRGGLPLGDLKSRDRGSAGESVVRVVRPIRRTSLGLVSHAMFFLACVALVLIWLPSYSFSPASTPGSS
jgi:hypothetical protein